MKYSGTIVPIDQDVGVMVVRVGGTEYELTWDPSEGEARNDAGNLADVGDVVTLETMAKA